MGLINFEEREYYFYFSFLALESLFSMRGNNDLFMYVFYRLWQANRHETLYVQVIYYKIYILGIK